ncbi:hypothetical protein DPEC_G00373360 [Dallia pectoralis]|nr:hypothetical protein DPEC_G00373360 [Dallia pectoralis]
MVFQAVAEYWTNVKDLKDVNLDINIEVAGRASVTRWSINNKNQFHTRTDKVNSIDKDLTLKASGNGEATVSVVTLYYALPEVDASDCTSFNLTVTLTKEDKTSHEDAKESFMLTIEMLYLNNERDATMSIMGGTLSRLCLGDVCKCAEESCTMQKRNEPDVKRIDKACDAGLDFVYKATVVDMKLTSHADTYTLKINEVIKLGSDEEVLGRNQDFLGLSYCREALGLKQGKTYMVMGKSADMQTVEEDGKLI